MKEILMTLMILHGIIHLLGFAKSAQIKELDQFTVNISKPFGFLWLIVAILFIASTIGILLNEDWWLYIAILSVISSQFLIIKYWVDAKTGTIINLLILVVLLIIFALK
jgi:hypothetical protein